ncbi:MAG: DUF3667 domain-containing protein [Saprospiraceae bacterium]|nr:DUF3667 domain-containing protein [Saprospiraceae bacterium]
MICRNCSIEVNSKFCQECGLATSLKRIDGQYIIHEIKHALHFEHGFLFTIRELITNPGLNIRNYLIENRSRLVKPIIFIIVTSLVYSLCNLFFHFEDGYVQHLDNKKSTTSEIFKWVQSHYGYANIIMGIFIAWWTQLFFKKHKYNFFEILILLCFVMGMGMLIYSIFGFFQGLTKIKLMQVGAIAGLIYTTWAVGNFFDERKISSYIKSFLAYILGMITFTLIIIAIGTLIDMATAS